MVDLELRPAAEEVADVTVGEPQLPLEAPPRAARPVDRFVQKAGERLDLRFDLSFNHGEESLC